MAKANRNQSTFRKVKLIPGETKMVGKRSIVGYCHCDTHKGFVTVSLYEKHECKKKNCVI